MISTPFENASNLPRETDSVELGTLRQGFADVLDRIEDRCQFERRDTNLGVADHAIDEISVYVHSASVMLYFMMGIPAA